jgi:catechol 2,3-dioxygenase-like lactoylglutathione lyase family enzyme
MSNVNGILETALYVDDVQRSSEFYQSLFGFAPVHVSDRLIALAVKAGQVLLLFKKRASLVLNTPHDGDGHLHVAFSISALDLDAWRDRLCEFGIPIESDQPWDLGGHSLFFRDPDGHLVEVGTPGIWRNY